MWGNNRVAFGVNGAVAPLVGYTLKFLMKSRVKIGVTVRTLKSPYDFSMIRIL